VHKLAWNVQHGDEYTTLRTLSERFFKNSGPTENERPICRVEVARHGEFDFGAGFIKKGWLFFKKRSDRAQVHLFAIGMCQNHVALDDCCGTPFCAETVPVFIALLQIFDLFFAGSPVATRFVTSHTYRIY